MTQPGTTQLTRMLSGPSSRARPRVRPLIGGLGGDIGEQSAIADHPGDRAEIDDRAAAGIAHLRPHRLGGEELVAQIDRHALVPIVERDVLDAMAVVIAGIVDQHPDGPVLLAPSAAIAACRSVDVRAGRSG